MQIEFDAARIAVAVAFLVYGSWSDYRTREVSNIVWAVFAPVSLGLTITEFLLYDPTVLSSFGISVALTSVVAFALFYSGGFGGADSKALICIAMALPFFPAGLNLPVAGEASPLSQMFFPITVFSNGVIFSAAAAIVILSLNVADRFKTRKPLFQGAHENEPFWKKALVLLTGYRMPIEKIKPKWHVYPLEDIEIKPEGQELRKLMLLPKDEGRDNVLERLEKAVENGKIEPRVWATPGLPMLIFIAAGLVCALVFGDLIWAFVKLLLG